MWLDEIIEVQTGLYWVKQSAENQYWTSTQGEKAKKTAPHQTYGIYNFRPIQSCWAQRAGQGEDKVVLWFEHAPVSRWLREEVQKCERVWCLRSWHSHYLRHLWNWPSLLPSVWTASLPAMFQPLPQWPIFCKRDLKLLGGEKSNWTTPSKASVTQNASHIRHLHGTSLS